MPSSGDLRRSGSDRLRGSRGALRRSGRLGIRRYAAGQWLAVWHEAAWRDVEVLEATSTQQHRLRIDGGGELTLALHPWNHAPLELPIAQFAELMRRCERIGARAAPAVPPLPPPPPPPPLPACLPRHQSRAVG